jgi:hypothetical protein
MSQACKSSLHNTKGISRTNPECNGIKKSSKHYSTESPYATVIKSQNGGIIFNKMAHRYHSIQTPESFVTQWFCQ